MRSLSDKLLFRHNNKQVDLSRTIRLSGLTSGARLELVQLSKSAGVVSVALQLPQDEAQNVPNGRITDKFPSTTTLWLLLRKFESGVAGSTTKRNLTARGLPSSNAGAGRLYYEQPVLNIMGRELATFTDLQKTLAQLGFNSGSVLVKLTYKISETPLEDAMTQIQGYFDEIEGATKEKTADVQEDISKMAEPEAHTEAQETTRETPQASSSGVKPEWLEDEQMQGVQHTSTSESTPNQPLQPESQSAEPLELQPTISDRPVSVYRPPTSNGPPPLPHHDSDYTPTIEHAQIHQKLLQQESRNKRLPTDAEIAAQQKERNEELRRIENVEIKIRFPDQSAVSSKFGQQDTASSLYNFARECLSPKLQNEPFTLRNPGVRDKDFGLIKENEKKLILNLGLKGRVLVVFGWDDKASPLARATKGALRDDLRKQAKEYIAPSIPTIADDQNDKGKVVDLGGPKKDEGSSVKGKLPKWLKGLGKK